MGQGRCSSGIGRPDIVIINANTCRKRKVYIKNNLQYNCVWRDRITVCWSLNIDAGTNLKLSFKTELSLKVVGLQFNEGLCVTVKFLVLFLSWIAHFKKEWKPGTQTKRALIYGIVCGTSRAATLNYDETWSNFRKFPVRAYLPLYELRFLSGCFGSTAKKPSLKLFHGWFRGQIAPGTSSSFSFTQSRFFLSIPPSVSLFWAV